jgi:polysaccharide biosynthesis transport protein
VRPYRAVPRLQRETADQTPRAPRAALPAPLASEEPEDALYGLVNHDMLASCRAATQRIDAGGPGVLGVTSTVRGEGRSTVAVAMAVVHRCDYESRVVLVDLDLERPRLATLLDLPPRPGLAELARGTASIDECLRPVADGFSLLPAGDAAGEVARIMNTLGGMELIHALRRRCDTVVLDMPPLLGTSAGLQAVAICTPALLVTRACCTPLPRVRQAVRMLPEALVVVLNGTSSALPDWLRRLLGDWA